MKSLGVLRVTCLSKEVLTYYSKCSIQQMSTIALESPVSYEALNKAKSFEEIPGPTPLPLIGNVHRYLPLIGEYSKANWHLSQVDKYKKYGNIVREVFLPHFSIVHLYDPADIEAITRNEGKFPKREFFLSMKKLREERPDIYSNVGVAAGNGETWHHLRSRTQKVMMRPQVMKQYLPQMNVIAEDLIQRMRNRRNADQQVPEFMNELFRWALESVCYILFCERLGCLSDDLDAKGQTFIKAVNSFFQTTAKVELSSFPIWMKYPMLSPAYQRLKKVHNFFFESSMAHVKEALKKIEHGKKEDDSSSLMEMLLHYCSPEDASVMAVDAMAAGIDTTSLTVAYVLRNLAANPEAQKKLQEEIDQVLPNGQQLTPEAMEQIPYLRACIKESMRISPTVQGTSRTLEKDIVLSGYRVPADTQVTMNYYVTAMLEKNFPEATKYKPERWLRQSDSFRTDSFAFQPFGFGPRMCIGRRIADLEMLTLLTKIIQNFWVENKHPELDINFQLVLMIKNPLLYEFHERK